MTKDCVFIENIVIYYYLVWNKE